MDPALASNKNIEIRAIPQFSGSSVRTATAENQEREGSEVIAILKDFFNV
jgi:hypothetical protein